MAAQGTLWKREGTMAFFYSKAKVWKPWEIRGIEPSSMVLGHKYEVDFDTKSIVRDLGRNTYHLENMQSHGLSTHGENAPSRQPSAPSQSAQEAPRSPTPDIPLHSLLASATGFAKSAMEGGQCKTWQAAALAGKAWAAMWAPEQVRALPPGVRRAEREATRDDSMDDLQPTPEERPEIDDELPF